MADSPPRRGIMYTGWYTGWRNEGTAARSPRPNPPCRLTCRLNRQRATTAQAILNPAYKSPDPPRTAKPVSIGVLVDLELAPDASGHIKPRDRVFADGLLPVWREAAAAAAGHAASRVTGRAVSRAIGAGSGARAIGADVLFPSTVSAG